MRCRNRVPGCSFLGSGRYGWRVRLPGEKVKKARPLVPAGGAAGRSLCGLAAGVRPFLRHDDGRFWREKASTTAAAFSGGVPG